ncbi:alanine racemase [Halalkalibacter kiskunsagensis]|uniref:Alanine racemase n=1 Tax=Halalkalibacter kiskunsagensis TaxID=1548599 RepID=A0ABV6KDI7_9BACI
MFDTPAVLIDEAKMKRNINNMQATINQQQVRLRPHIKTHKIPSIANLQLQAGAIGITVAKVSEAEVMAAHGIKDIFIAYPIVTETKIRKMLELSKKIRLIVGVDSLAGAKLVDRLAREEALTIEVRIEVDTGLRRTGVQYHDAPRLALEIARLESLNVTGIYTFRGALYQGKPTLDLEKAGQEEGQLMVELAKQLRDAGIEIQDVSVGSTPSADAVSKVQGITEVRPGTYIFYDRMQAAFNVCQLEDCAASVTCTVVSIPSNDLIVIDGGSKTFASDVQPAVAPLHLEGFGAVVNVPGAIFERMTEEHGMIKVPKTHRLKVGDNVEIIPNHICSTVNLHNYVYLKTENGDLKPLEVLARGKVQ